MSKDKRQLRAEAVERLEKLRRTDYSWDDVIEAMLAERDPRYTIVSQLIDLLSDDEQPETFHDDFYDCESTVDAGEDTREKLESDCRKLIVKIQKRTFSGRDATALRCQFYELLDRQAAITERQGREEWRKAASGEIYQAKQESDELREKYNDLLERRTKVECDCDCCKWQAERDEWKSIADELREEVTSLYAKMVRIKKVMGE